VLDSGKVASWTDLSGVSTAPAQGTAGVRPTVASAALNGHDAVDFAGGNFLDHGITLQPPCTVAFVAQYDTDVGQYQPIVSLATGTHGLFVYAKSIGAGSQWGIYANENLNSGATLETWKRCIIVARSYTDVDFWTNGAKTNNSTGGASGYNGGALVGTGGGAQILSGKIATLSGWTVAHADPTVLRIDSYLARRYAL